MKKLVVRFLFFNFIVVQRWVPGTAAEKLDGGRGRPSADVTMLVWWRCCSCSVTFPHRGAVTLSVLQADSGLRGVGMFVYSSTCETFARLEEALLELCASVSLWWGFAASLRDPCGMCCRDRACGPDGIGRNGCLLPGQRLPVLHTFLAGKENLKECIWKNGPARPQQGSRESSARKPQRNKGSRKRTTIHKTIRKRTTSTTSFKQMPPSSHDHRHSPLHKCWPSKHGAH